MADKGLFEQLNDINFIELDGLLSRWKGWHEDSGPIFNTFIIVVCVAFAIGVAWSIRDVYREDARVQAAIQAGTYDPIAEFNVEMSKDPGWRAYTIENELKSAYTTRYIKGLPPLTQEEVNWRIESNLN